MKFQPDDISDVAAFLQKAVAEHPDFMAARMALVRVYLLTGEIDAAAALVADTEDKLGKTPELTRLSGDILLRQGDLYNAAGAYLEYMQARPYDLQAADLRTFVLIHKVKKDQQKLK